MDDILLIIIIVAIIGFSCAFISLYFYLASIDTFCDVVVEKWIKYHDDDAKYLISTENNGILENTDELIAWKFDSSDVYARIKVGERYCFKTIGWRVPFFSWYKNVIEVKEDSQ